MEADEEFHTCPNADCSWGALFSKGDGNILSCPMCNTRYCMTCQVPFHEGQTCEAYQSSMSERDKNEQKSIERVAEISRKCPGCGAIDQSV